MAMISSSQNHLSWLKEIIFFVWMSYVIFPDPIILFSIHMFLAYKLMQSSLVD